MNSTVNKIAAVAIALVAAVPAFAGTQVVAGNGVTLTEAAQAKFNRDTRPDDRHPIVVPGQASGDYGQLAAVAGLTAEEAQGMSLNEIYVAKINREARGDDKQAVKGGQVTMGTRSSPSPALQRAADRRGRALAGGSGRDEPDRDRRRQVRARHRHRRQVSPVGLPGLPDPLTPAAPRGRGLVFEGCLAPAQAVRRH